MKAFPILIAFFCFLGMLVVIGSGQEPASEDKRITLSVEKKPFQALMAQLLFDNRVAVGFEESEDDFTGSEYFFDTNPSSGQVESYSGNNRKHLKLFTLKVKDARLGDIMNALVKEMGDYEWKLVSGVVNISPAKSRNERLQRLLDTEIKNFRLTKGYPVGLIRSDILKLPEVASFLTENKMRVIAKRSAGDPARPLTADINLKAITLRELLNSVLRVTGGGWALKQASAGDLQGVEFDVS